VLKKERKEGSNKNLQWSYEKALNNATPAKIK
jgi:hypothetical protein